MESYAMYYDPDFLRARNLSCLQLSGETLNPEAEGWLESYLLKCPSEHVAELHKILDRVEAGELP